MSTSASALSAELRVPLPRINLALLALAPVLFAVLGVALGKKTGWDLHNYHWYNPFALLNDRFAMDVGVGHHATYYNPLSDVPLYLIGSWLPSWTVGAFLGAMAGVAVALLGAIAYQALRLHNDFYRSMAAAGLALLGAIGAGAWQEIGDPANDIPAAIGIFAALWLLLSRSERLIAPDRASLRIVALAGALCGMSVGLKLTTAPFALGLIAVAACIGGGFKVRFTRTTLFGIGALFGMLACSGFWMWRMWEFSGNPLFPYFNDIFKSPLILADNYRDLNFRPKDIVEYLMFPFLFSSDSHHVSESSFRDLRVAALYVLLPIAAVFMLGKPVRDDIVDVRKAKLLFVFAAVSYFAWSAVFGIYRYLIPLEMIAPVLIACVAALLPMPGRRFALFAAVVVSLQLFVRVDLSDRQSWRGPYVQVHVPPLATTNNMVLMTGHEPMAYVIPSFPREIPFVRIDSWLVHGSDRTTGLARSMRARVAAHTGSLWVLFAPLETQAMLDALRNYDLALRPDSCRPVTSNVGVTLALCEAAWQSG